MTPEAIGAWLVSGAAALGLGAAAVNAHRHHRHRRRTRWSVLTGIASGEGSHSEHHHGHWHEDDRARWVRDRIVIRAREQGIVPAPTDEELAELVERSL